MDAQTLNLWPAAPEIFMLAMVCVILVVDLFLDEARRHVSLVLTLLTLLVTAALAAAGGTGVHHIFNGMFVADPMSQVLKVFICIAVGAMLVYGREYARLRGLFRGELFALALFSTLGMMVMVSASHFLTLYLGLELMSLCLYSMVALSRDSASATEAAMKYFVLGALASGMLLYGLSMVYGATGSLQIAEVAGKIASHHANQTLLVFGLVFVVAGLGFKLGAVPFHMWLPDVYHGAPTAVTLLIGSAPKLAYFALAFRLLGQGLQGVAEDWSQMLAALAVLTLIVGNLVALAQPNIKRLLAYSTIANVGFIVLGFVTGTAGGYSASLYYTLVYVLTALGSFGVVILASRQGFEADQLDDYKGLYKRDPLLAFIMMVLMFSTAGVPPFVGFWAKLRIIQELWVTGHTWLVLLAAGTDRKSVV